MHLTDASLLYRRPDLYDELGQPDVDTINVLIARGCWGVTVEQIAKDFGVHPMTLFKRLRQGRRRGRRQAWRDPQRVGRAA